MIPDFVRRARLLRKSGGYLIVPHLLAPGLLSGLSEEAELALSTARQSQVARSDAESDWRGGSPARKFLSAHGGPAQESFYQHPNMLGYLASLLGCRLTPSGMRGTFSYYSRPGDFIGIHRDVDTCDVAVITCLRDSHPNKATNSGKLVFYPGRLEESNSAIRANPGPGAETHRLAPGETAILMGGLVAHAVLPVEEGQQRVVSVLCYTAAAG